MHRFAKAASGKIRFRDRTPMSINAVNRDHVVGVTFGFKIENQRRKAVRPQSRCRKNGSLQAMSGFFEQHPPRRPCGVGQVIWQVIQIALNAVRASQAAEFAQFRPAEAGVTVVHGWKAVYLKV